MKKKIIRRQSYVSKGTESFDLPNQRIWFISEVNHKKDLSTTVSFSISLQVNFILTSYQWTEWKFVENWNSLYLCQINITSRNNFILKKEPVCYSGKETDENSTTLHKKRIGEELSYVLCIWLFTPWYSSPALTMQHSFSWPKAICLCGYNSTEVMQWPCNIYCIRYESRVSETIWGKE